jgi:hypothetical protein
MSVHGDRLDRIVYAVLGVVEISYYPAVALAVLLTVEAVVSPIPAVALSPPGITLADRGLAVTALLEVAVVVAFVHDLLALIARGELTMDSPGSGTDE